MNRQFAIHKDSRGGYAATGAGGKVIRGYASKSALLDVIARAGDVAHDITGEASAQAVQELVVWTFISIGRQQCWRATRGGITVATAERDNPEQFYNVKILCGGESIAWSITEIAERLLKTQNTISA